MRFRSTLSLTCGAVALAATLGAQAPVSQPPAKAVVLVAAAALEKQLPNVTGWTRNTAGSDHVAIADGCDYVSVNALYKNGDVTVRLILADSGAVPDNLTTLAPMVVLLPPDHNESIAPATVVKRFELGGQPAASRYDGKAREAEVTVLVDGRFVVRAEARDVASLDPLMAILTNVNFTNLAALK